MSAPTFDLVDMDVETTNDHSETSKKNNSPSARLERRRRIEELNEEKFRREEWGDY